MLVWCEIDLKYCISGWLLNDCLGQLADNLATALDVEPQGQGVLHGSWTEAPLGADSFYRLATSVMCLPA